MDIDRELAAFGRGHHIATVRDVSAMLLRAIGEGHGDLPFTLALSPHPNALVFYQAVSCGPFKTISEIEHDEIHRNIFYITHDPDIAHEILSTNGIVRGREVTPPPFS